MKIFALPILALFLAFSCNQTDKTKSTIEDNYSNVQNETTLPPTETQSTKTDPNRLKINELNELKISEAQKNGSSGELNKAVPLNLPTTKVIKERKNQPVQPREGALEEINNPSPQTTVEQVVEEPIVQTTEEITQSTPTSTSNPTPKPIAKRPEKEIRNTPTHSYWHAILQTFVSNEGLVDYKAISRNQNRMEEYLHELESFPPQSDWSDETTLAYWINAYNAYTIKLIVDHYPVSSIKEVYNGKPWDKKWIKIDGKLLSLNDIEHNIIRKNFDEPRIHFAVVCAAKSCPPLVNEAFTAENLSTLLERRAKEFINNETFNKTSSAQVSKIFEWYGSDFGDVRAYINRYAKTDIPSGKSITFLDYDWSLNQQ